MGSKPIPAPVRWRANAAGATFSAVDNALGSALSADHADAYRIVIRDSLQPSLPMTSPKSILLPRALSVTAIEHALQPNPAPSIQNPISVAELLGPRTSRAELVQLDHPEDLTFDLRDCEWIRPSALLYLTAIFRNRAQKTLPTHMVLPSLLRARFFMEAWGFHRAFKLATDQSLSSICTGPDSAFFDDSPHHDNPYLGDLVSTPLGPDRLLPRRYFEINTFRKQFELFDTPFALDEARRWERMQQVLRHVLTGPSTLFGSRIIYEVLANAVRHPEAALIQIVSEFQESKGTPRTFSVSVWDDGSAIGSTLKRAVLSGLPIRRAGGVGLATRYQVRAATAFDPNNCSVSEISSDDLPEQGSTEDSYLLASLFPGTSRDIRSQPDDEATRLLGDKRVDTLVQPGMGLYLLANTAVSVFGGQLDIRTGDWRLILTPWPTEASRDFGGRAPAEAYKATMLSYPGWRPFPGNLITVTLPLVELGL